MKVIFLVNKYLVLLDTTLATACLCILIQSGSASCSLRVAVLYTEDSKVDALYGLGVILTDFSLKHCEIQFQALACAYLPQGLMTVADTY